jgi:hypothetical protein
MRYRVGAAAVREDDIYSCRATGLDVSGWNDPPTASRSRRTRGALSQLDSRVVFDEAQRVPELSQFCAASLTTARSRNRFGPGVGLSLLVSHISESLAVAPHSWTCLRFVGAGQSHPQARDLKTLWFRGGFPEAFLDEMIAHDLTGWNRTLDPLSNSTYQL